MDYFSALSVFHSVAETGSFSATAKQLDVAVSSVTRQIDNLEQALAVKLFHRSTRQIALTNAGVHYQQQTQHLLADLHQANLSLKQAQTEPQGKLKITFPPTFGSIKLSEILPEFTRRFPKIELELDGSDEFVDLQTGRFDLAIRLGKVDDQQLIAHYLAPLKRVLCTSPQYLQQNGLPKTPADLAQHNCLRFVHHGYAAKWHFSHPTKPHQAVSIRGNLSANNTEILLNYALSGIGIAHLPDWLIDEPLRQGKLVTLFDDWAITPSALPEQENDGIYLVYAPNSRQILKIQLLIAFLREKLSPTML